MYDVTIEKTQYRVGFHHDRLDPRYMLEQMSRAVTGCTIDALLDPADLPLSQERTGDGMAFCHRNDNFNKNTGRKLSLARALKDAGFDRNIRELFWQGYFEARGRID